jgi:hypothetical protein
MLDAMLLLCKWTIFRYFGVSVLGTALANLGNKQDGASEGSGAGVPNFVRALSPV